MGKQIGKREGYILVPEDWKPEDDWLPNHHPMKEAQSNKRYWEQPFMPNLVNKRIIKATVVYEELEDEKCSPPNTSAP